MNKLWEDAFIYFFLFWCDQILKGRDTWGCIKNEWITLPFHIKVTKESIYLPDC